jgi:hypothetical protein
MRPAATILLVAVAACGDGAAAPDAAAAGDATASADAAPAGDAGPCVAATLLWSEDWETGDYSRWTSQGYGDDWGNECQSNGLSQDRAHSPTHSHRSEITCAYTAEGNVHRGYGGLQFDGDQVLPAYTNQGAGIDAPHGVVNTFHVWFDSSTTFENGTWFSLWTINGTCDWSEHVLTLGLEDPSDRLAAAHYWWDGGERTFTPNAPGLPRGEWVRITIYVNYHDQTMHVWQNGTKISDVTFTRASTRICQWHWGAYASGDNTDAVLHEDDNSIWKLEEPWADLDVEPWLGASQPVCD